MLLGSPPEFTGMSQRYEIRLSGTGGQGVVLAGIMLAEAAGTWRQGQHVVQTVSYGPQVRGGLSSAEVVISDEEIDYPRPIRLDLLIPFTQEAANESAGHLKPEGIILYDPDLVRRAPQGWVATVPLTKLALEIAGRSQTANIVALGAAAALAPVLNFEALEAALRERATGKLQEQFIKAAGAGYQAADRIRDKIPFNKVGSAED